MNESTCQHCGGSGKLPIFDALFDAVTGEAPCPMCTFVCAECQHTLPVSHRHAERPEVCFLDYVSPADRAEIDRVIAEGGF